MNTYLKISLVATGFGFLTPSTNAWARMFDGNYVSNEDNKLTISGDSYTYHGVYGGPLEEHGTVEISGDNIRFVGGYLKYLCVRKGSYLLCDGGRRSWKRQ